MLEGWTCPWMLIHNAISQVLYNYIMIHHHLIWTSVAIFASHAAYHSLIVKSSGVWLSFSLFGSALLTLDLVC